MHVISPHSDMTMSRNGIIAFIIVEKQVRGRKAKCHNGNQKNGKQKSN